MSKKDWLRQEWSAKTLPNIIIIIIKTVRIIFFAKKERELPKNQVSFNLSCYFSFLPADLTGMNWKDFYIGSV